MYFSCDVNLPVLLDFEIWKASNMLFQIIPIAKKVDHNTAFDSTWDDNWHKETCQPPKNAPEKEQENNQV